MASSGNFITSSGASKSNVRIEALFDSPVVFAGESLSVIVTFRNVAPAPVSSFAASIAPNRVDNLTPHSGIRSDSVAQTEEVANSSTSEYIPQSDRRNSAFSDQSDVVAASSAAGPTAEGERGHSESTTNDDGLLKPPKNDQENPQDNQEEPKSRSSFDFASAGRFSSQISDTLRGVFGIGSSGDEGEAGQRLSRANTSAGANHRRKASVVSSATEEFIMGSAHIQGYFQIDKELVREDAFAKMKTHGVVVGKHGLEYGGNGNDRSDDGVLRGLTTGLGNLLREDGGNNNVGDGHNGPAGSGSSDDRDYPIFSTPQSLLFVDLKLGPGESRSYVYQLKLPDVLPPSYKGRAIKIQYTLVVSAQKLEGGGKIPRNRIIQIPFRVFPHVDNEGHQHVHNITEPIVQKKDEATVVEIKERWPNTSRRSSFIAANIASATKLANMKTGVDTLSTADDPQKKEFLSYLDSVLKKGGETSQSAKSKNQNSDGKGEPAVSATSHLNAPRHQSITEMDIKNYTVRESIDFFVKYQHTKQSDSLTNKQFKRNYDINRGGKRIASVRLSKPVYRVGEEVQFLVDFHDSDYKCLHLCASLETVEKIDKSINAKAPVQTSPGTAEDRNPNSISDAQLDEEIAQLSRRVFSRISSSVYSVSRSSFDLTIPSSGSPQFSTSLSSVRWYLRLDFVTTSAQMPKRHPANVPNATGEDGSKEEKSDPVWGKTRPRSSSIESPYLLKLESYDGYGPADHEDVRHSKGDFYVARPTIPSDSFSCQIPLQVYPTNQDISALQDHSMRRRWLL